MTSRSSYGAPTLYPNSQPKPEHFRSWGETQIGRMLNRYGIPYLYEPPLAVVDDRGHTRIWYPDFSLRGYGMLLEYFGRAHEPEYAAAMSRKQTIYEANGLTSLFLTAEDLRGNWPTRLLDRIEATLRERVQGFRGARRKTAGSGALQMGVSGLLTTQPAASASRAANSMGKLYL